MTCADEKCHTCAVREGLIDCDHCGEKPPEKGCVVCWKKTCVKCDDVIPVAALDQGEEEKCVKCGDDYPATPEQWVKAFPKKPCDSENCCGWAVFEEHGDRNSPNAIERCDTCKRFPDDETAVEFVKAMAELGEEFAELAAKAEERDSRATTSKG